MIFKADPILLQLRRRRQRSAGSLRRNLGCSPCLLLRHRPPQRRPLQSWKASSWLPEPLAYVLNLQTPANP